MSADNVAALRQVKTRSISILAPIFGMPSCHGDRFRVLDSGINALTI